MIKNFAKIWKFWKYSRTSHDHSRIQYEITCLSWYVPVNHLKGLRSTDTQHSRNNLSLSHSLSLSLSLLSLPLSLSIPLPLFSPSLPSACNLHHIFCFIADIYLSYTVPFMDLLFRWIYWYIRTLLFTEIIFLTFKLLYYSQKQLPSAWNESDWLANCRPNHIVKLRENRKRFSWKLYKFIVYRHAFLKNDIFTSIHNESKTHV